jgi:hypothetical protein
MEVCERVRPRLITCVRVTECASMPDGASHTCHRERQAVRPSGMICAAGCESIGSRAAPPRRRLSQSIFAVECG